MKVEKKSKEISKNSTRIAVIDYIKGICIFLVITDHFCSAFLRSYLQKNVFHSFVLAMAVPVFMLVSG